MDRRVTGSAHDQRFSLPCRHQSVPLRYRFVPTALEIRQLADMMHLDVERAAAQLARVGLEPFEQLRPLRVRPRRSLVDEDCVLPAAHREAPELCYQGS